jgi:hypothetical protein
MRYFIRFIGFPLCIITLCRYTRIVRIVSPASLPFKDCVWILGVRQDNGPDTETMYMLYHYNCGFSMIPLGDTWFIPIVILIELLFIGLTIPVFRGHAELHCICIYKSHNYWKEYCYNLYT